MTGTPLGAWRGGHARARVELTPESEAAMSAESVPGRNDGTLDGVSKSEGKEDASVSGCSANNGNASARTLNCNNGLGNGNSNYAGAFAVISGRNANIGKSLASRASSTKTTDSRAATCGYGRCDYGSLPFAYGGEEKAESNATSYRKEAVMNELATAS